MENTAITVGGIFEAAGETMTGFVEMTADFFTALWSNPMGQIVITIGLVSGAIGLARSLYLRRKHVAG